MSGSVAYLDTLALPKLVISEPESPALLTSILRWPDRAAAALLRSEAIGALGGLDNTQPSARLDNSSEPCGLLTSMSPCSTGPANSPLALRSLEAIHLAAALAIGPDLAVLLTYDRRLAEAARGAGLLVDSLS